MLIICFCLGTSHNLVGSTEICLNRIMRFTVLVDKQKQIVGIIIMTWIIMITLWMALRDLTHLSPNRKVHSLLHSSLEAITGEATLQKCERIRTALDQSLFQIQNMVPQMLAAQIFDAIDYLREAKFIIDPTEEEACKVMLELLRQTDASEEFEFEAFQIAALRLHVTSLKAILIEKRSVKKLLDKIHGTDSKKEMILNYFLYLLKKYGKRLSSDVNEQRENASVQSMISSRNSKCNDSNYAKNEDTAEHAEAQTALSSTNIPPEEFCCPISSRLMYDPVVIASGQTYERICIEKWFSEGHDTCPKTQKKLENLLMIPNTCMKDLISLWCETHGVNVQVISVQSNISASQPWEPSHCYSISSLKNVSVALLFGNTGDRMLQNDHSNVSLLSSDGYCSDSSHFKSNESSEDGHALTFSWSDDYQNCRSFSSFSHDMFLRFFYGLSELPLELQDKSLNATKSLLEDDEDTCNVMLSNGFAEALITFLKSTKEQSNAQAQRIGAQILLSFLSYSRVEIPSLSEDTFQLLASFLDSAITIEALMIMQKLAYHLNCKTYIEANGVPPTIIKILECKDAEFQELAVKILYDLSSQSEIKPYVSSSGCIPRLVPLLSNGKLAEICIKILRNLSDIEDAAGRIAETNGCLASIAELLESDSQKEQEHAVAILHSLCSRGFEYCQLVLKEGIIPSLVDISVNGSPKGKETSMKLLHLLRDLRHSDCFDCSDSQSESTSKSKEHFVDLSTKSEPTSKSSGFFGRKIRFLKPRSLPLF